MQESDTTSVASLGSYVHPAPSAAPSAASREEQVGPTDRTPLDGELAFASEEAQVQRISELLGAGAMVVEVPSPPASMRGRLAEHVDERVERALGIRGAPSPYLTTWASMPEDAEARLADQLFRARTVGATGIAIAMGSLARIAAPALTPEDSAALRALARATHTSPLAVLIDDGDAAMGGYGEPVALDLMLRMAKASARVEELAEELETRAPAPSSEPACASTTEPEPQPESAPQLAAEADPVSVPEAEMAVEAGMAVEIEVAVAVEAAPCVEPPDLTETAVDAPVAEKTAPEILTIPPPPAPVDVIKTVAREAARRRATAGVPVSGPSDFWRSWAIALSAARGPQPLAAFERLFVESYMPLANAIAEGLDDPRAVRAHDEFRDGFERTYADAFVTFGVTGRRPRLVMDAFDVAVKQARLHNARATHVLVVDAMRHDLGCIVRDQIAARAAGTISLTSESLLWSALPTTTYRQLETLARGMDALRAPAADEGSESLRGRSAETVRRMRVGSRELYKLDVVPSMLGALPDPNVGASAAHVVAALSDIGASVADALLRHVETLTPRTLLLVLGDHGFTVDRKGRITHGGATPEEVLVPCLAYLVGDLH